MGEKFLILKIMLIGLTFFFIRYSFYLTGGKLEKKKYLIALGISIIAITSYFLYLKFLTP